MGISEDKADCICLVTKLGSLWRGFCEAIKVVMVVVWNCVEGQGMYYIVYIVPKVNSTLKTNDSSI